MQRAFASLSNHRLRLSRSLQSAMAGTKDRSALIPFSSRLRDGRALAQDVWSIFKSVQLQSSQDLLAYAQDTLVWLIFRPIASI